MAKDQEAPKEEAKAGGAEASKSSRLKIGKMTIEDVESRLEKVKTAMGGTYSAHARALIARKEMLLRSNGSPKKSK